MRWLEYIAENIEQKRVPNVAFSWLLSFCHRYYDLFKLTRKRMNNKVDKITSGM